MKRRWFILMILSAAMLLGACAGVVDKNTDTTSEMSSVQEKLNKIDAYKETLPAQSFALNGNEEEMIFRGFSFGMSKDVIKTMETLPLKQSFSDALDYTGSGIYGYDMLLTYWFNIASQLYSVSYSMENDAYFDTLNSLMEKLRGDYGEPTDSGYYDSADNAVSFDSDTEAMQAVDNDGAYYYAAFADSNGIDIELYARKIDTGYDYWVYYTDYSYYIE